MVIKVRISANSKDEAAKISDELIEKEVIAGSLITSGDSRYRWEDDIKKEEYYNIQAYTIRDLKQDIIDKVEEIHSDDVPIVEFTEITGNKKFIRWIKDSVSVK